MKHQPHNGETDIKNLSDEEFQIYLKQATLMVVEADLTTRSHKQALAMATEELEFRKSGKPRRPDEDWNQLWVQAVHEVAEAQGLSFEDTWKIALLLFGHVRDD